MPITFWTFLAGTLALTGIPIWAGFWSKDEILSAAYYKGIEQGVAIALFVWFLATVAAFLTALYMSRQVFMVFAGKPRTEAAQHAPESEPAMAYPLIFLAICATVLGLLGIPEDFPVVGGILDNPIHHFTGTLTGTHAHVEPVPFRPIGVVLSIGIAVLGWVVGWALYGRAPEASRERDPLRRLGPIWTLLYKKYYVDEIYSATFVRFSIWFANFNAAIDQYIVDGLVNLAGIAGEAFSRVNGWIDTHIVDGAVNLTAAVHTEMSRGLRLLQTGRVQQYLLVVFFGLLFLVGAIMF
jgi:NADH-quinone oxidoreductase subunit L